MNYQKITKFDTANGPGIRTVLWVSGCTHRCKGCHNSQTWDENSGEPFTDSTLETIISSLKEPYITGLTLSGGDPLAPYNQEIITQITKTVKKIYPYKTIWCYTGFDWETVKNLEVMKYLDVLIDGKFHIEERNITLPYCGSTNQRIIDVQKSLKLNEIVIYC